MEFTNRLYFALCSCSNFDERVDEGFSDHIAEPGCGFKRFLVPTLTQEMIKFDDLFQTQ